MSEFDLEKISNGRKLLRFHLPCVSFPTIIDIFRYLTVSIALMDSLNLLLGDITE